MNNIADLRKDYKLQKLSENDASKNPFLQFSKWWNEAMAANIEEPNAMTLATVGVDNKPSARIVLLKEMDEAGFVFYTNYESHKAKDMQLNENVALLFFWKELERQVRIEGRVKKISAEESDKYFLSRPEESKIGAWSSPQSEVIVDRNVLEKNIALTKEKFKNTVVERPLFWGGYKVTPILFEFWQGRSNRLHDRLQFQLENNNWLLKRLAP